MAKPSEKAGSGAEGVKIEQVPTVDLVPYARNSRTHSDEQVAQIAASIREFGFCNPVLIDVSGTIIAGHGRVMAATRMKLETVPCLRLTHLTDAQKRAYVIADNRLALNSGWDSEMLSNELSDLHADEFDLGLLGFDADELAELLNMSDNETADTGKIVEDEVPDPPADPVTKPGDLWTLGDHRLLCGDSTKAEDVERLMAGAKGRLIATDPPYGVDFSGARYCPTAKKWEGIANDKRQGDDLCEWLTSMWSTWLKWVEDDSSFYSWCAAMEEGAAAAAAMRKAGIHVQSQIIWVKNALVLGQADYQWRHENCWYGFLKGKQHRWFGERDKTTVWEIKKVSSSQYVHPMQKPVDLYATSMKHHTLKGDIVCEPFSGSGTQFIAAEQLGRKCYGMEISPAYCDVIVKRWENLTGKKATQEATCQN